MMLEVISYALLGIVSSFHIGNSLMNDGLGNNDGNVQTGTFGLEAIADGYGYADYTLAMHIDASQNLTSIWDNPDGVGVGGVDATRQPYGNYAQALSNYHWDHVLLEPYLANSPTLPNGSTIGADKIAIANFINLTRQNPSNQDTVFYVYQVWPRQSWGNYSDYWLYEQTVTDETATRPRRQLYDHFMSWAHETYDPQGILVREIPVGEVLNRINLMIESGEITGITMADLYRDDLHASGPLGRYVAAVTNYATMFQQDVNGLVPPPAQFGTFYPQSLYDTLNKLIWEVVTSDSDTGIADFNDDGYVSSADLALWNSAFGVNAAGDTDSDGDTDGRDFLNWQRNYGGEPPAVADFNDDGYVSSSDLALWNSAFGVNAAGDTDGDGDTDGRDFLNWQRSYGGEPPALSVALSTIVPEPTGAILALFGLLGLVSRPRYSGNEEARKRSGNEERV